jgi:hypothetical protein
MDNAKKPLAPHEMPTSERGYEAQYQYSWMPESQFFEEEPD